MEMNATRAMEKDLEVVIDYKPHVPSRFISDVGKIRQILMNIVSNAVKFTDNGYVLINVDSQKVDDGSSERILQKHECDSTTECLSKHNITICIKDTGIGIKREDWKNLFLKYYQVVSTSTRTCSGTGLGLAISHILASKLDGELFLKESEVDSGSLFCIKLPLIEACASTTSTFRKSENIDEDDVSNDVMSIPCDEKPFENINILFIHANLQCCNAFRSHAKHQRMNATIVQDIDKYDAYSTKYHVVCIDNKTYNSSNIEKCDIVEKFTSIEPRPKLVLMTNNVTDGALITHPFDVVLIKPLRWTYFDCKLRSLLGTHNTTIKTSINVKPDILIGMRVLVAEDNIVNQVSTYFSFVIDCLTYRLESHVDVS